MSSLTKLQQNFYPGKSPSGSCRYLKEIDRKTKARRPSGGCFQKNPYLCTRDDADSHRESDPLRGGPFHHRQRAACRGAGCAAPRPARAAGERGARRPQVHGLRAGFDVGVHPQFRHHPRQRDDAGPAQRGSRVRAGARRRLGRPLRRARTHAEPLPARNRLPENPPGLRRPGDGLQRRIDELRGTGLFPSGTARRSRGSTASASSKTSSSRRAGGTPSIPSRTAATSCRRTAARPSTAPPGRFPTDRCGRFLPKTKCIPL